MKLFHVTKRVRVHFDHSPMMMMMMMMLLHIIYKLALRRGLVALCFMRCLACIYAHIRQWLLFNVKKIKLNYISVSGFYFNSQSIHPQAEKLSNNMNCWQLMYQVTLDFCSFINQSQSIWSPNDEARLQNIQRVKRSRVKYDLINHMASPR